MKLRGSWFEIRLRSVDQLPAAYYVADDVGALSVHHFNGEPWHPDAPVVRVLLPRDDWAAQATLRSTVDRDDLGTLHRWDAGPDERQYGRLWPDVARFFEAASRLEVASMRSHRRARVSTFKLVHCALNAWGFSVAREREFHRLARQGRARMLRHDLWYRLRPGTRCRYGCHPVVAR